MRNRQQKIAASPRCASWVALAAAGFVALGCDAGGAEAKSPGGLDPLVGKPAPEFDLPAQSGSSRASLEAARGKVSLVDFWATWCGPCKASFPRYQVLSKEYGDDLIVIGISEDDDPEGIKDFAKVTGVTFTLAWDANKNVAATYHPGSMPTSFLVDKDGIIRFVHDGFRKGDDQLINDRIKALIQ